MRSLACFFVVVLGSSRIEADVPKGGGDPAKVRGCFAERGAPKVKLELDGKGTARLTGRDTGQYAADDFEVTVYWSKGGHTTYKYFRDETHQAAMLVTDKMTFYLC